MFSQRSQLLVRCRGSRLCRCCESSGAFDSSIFRPSWPSTSCPQLIWLFVLIKPGESPQHLQVCSPRKVACFDSQHETSEPVSHGLPAVLRTAQPAPGSGSICAPRPHRNGQAGGFLKRLPRWCLRTLPISFGVIGGSVWQESRRMFKEKKRRNHHLWFPLIRRGG